MSVSQLESFDSGSNYNFGDKMIRPAVPRSLFDLSHLVATTIPNDGMVIPLGEPIETVPGDDFDISVDFLLRVLPQVVPLYSRKRVYVYGFFSRYADLCSDFDVMMTKGYTGNVIKALPKMSSLFPDYEGRSDTVRADSILSYLGLPLGANIGALSKVCHSLWFMQLLRIWRDYFINRNYYINDRVILPDDDSRFRLGSDGHLMSATDLGVEFKFVDDWTGYSGFNGDPSTTVTFGGFYHDYPSDRFLSALPFPQRGDAPTLPLDISAFSSIANISPVGSDYEEFGLRSSVTIAPNSPVARWRNVSGSLVPVETSSTAGGNETYLSGKARINFQDGFTVDSGISLNAIRELAIAQTELEKMARTDGSYAQFGLTFFNERSKATRNFTPIYIGGSYRNIVFNEVLQTSAGNDSSESTPLGSYAGHGIAGQEQGYLGHFHADDYGSIMLLACVMPDVYYSQGLSVGWTRSMQSDFYLPERAKLGMIPILNRELYFSGDSSVDGDLFAYQSPWDELRYRPNTVSGKIADPNNESFYPYVTSRYFDSTPNWSRELANASNVSKNYLQAPSEDAYSAQFQINIRAVRPIPYRAVSASII